MLASAMAASEALLHKVFPAHVAEALKEGKKVQPEEYPCVTIFFSDIVNFTTIASSMEPALVMSMLDRLYTKFDILTERYDIFKVETIGDAYMAVVCTCTYTHNIYTHANTQVETDFFPLRQTFKQRSLMIMPSV